MGVLLAGWNLVYWFKGFYPRIFRLCPEIQARTGARIRIRYRSIEWDRPVGWKASLALQVHFLGLVLTAFLLWGVLLVLVIALLAFLQDGLAGAAKFFRG